MDVARTILSGRVIGRSVAKNMDGDHEVLMLQTVVTGDSDIRKVELMQHAGLRTNPPAGSRVSVVSIGRKWRVAVSCDDKISPGEDEGETRVYASNGGGIVCEIHFKNDGTIDVNADTEVNVVSPLVNITAETSVTITSPIVNIVGKLNVSDGIETTEGSDMVVSGSITVTGDVTAEGVSTAHHRHPETQVITQEPLVE